LLRSGNYSETTRPRARTRARKSQTRKLQPRGAVFPARACAGCLNSRIVDRMTMPIQFSDGPSSPCAPPTESMNENSAAPCIFHRLIPPWRFPVCGKYADLISASFLPRSRLGVAALNDFCLLTEGRIGGAPQSSRGAFPSLQQRRFFEARNVRRKFIISPERTRNFAGGESAAYHDEFPAKAICIKQSIR